MTFKSFIEAADAARGERPANSANGLTTETEASPYGGYRVVTEPADLVIDDLTDGPNTNPRRKKRWTTRTYGGRNRWGGDWTR